MGTFPSPEATTERIGDNAGGAISTREPRAEEPMAAVTPGLERLITEGPASAGLSAGARLGLVAHAASIDRRGRHAVDLLRSTPELTLTKLFAPEHGLWGHEQDMERVAGAVDPFSGLEVISLYGDDAGSLKPRRESLSGLDAVVVDLQDVGSRYYTYVYTLSYVMEAAAETGVPVVVLDRPNPLGGEHVEGPVLDPGLASFVGRYPLPVRHGLTVGELARFFNDALGIGCELRVVPLEGWSRADLFESTGLPWVAPSPNMPSLATARVYPGGCLVEGTNLSEGRGTTQPFELVGAPWLDGSELVERLRDQGLPGAIFRHASFRPMFGKHAGSPCGGVQVLVEDRCAFRPFATYLALLAEARRVSPGEFAWRTEPYEFESERLAIDLLLGRSDLRPMIEGGAALAEMESLWREELERFDELRSGYLLYPRKMP
jgi:uncharacterized protein YbbC (DUF1343 family)